MANIKTVHCLLTPFQRLQESSNGNLFSIILIQLVVELVVQE